MYSPHSRPPMKLGRIGMPKGRTRMGTMTRIHRRATGSASATETKSRASHPTEGDMRKRQPASRCLGKHMADTLSTDCILLAVNHTLEPSTPALPDLCIPGRNGEDKKACSSATHKRLAE
jgi:hypothetical protein